MIITYLYTHVVTPPYMVPLYDTVVTSLTIVIGREADCIRLTHVALVSEMSGI